MTQAQAKHILERSYRSSIERTGVPPNKFIMNLATLKTMYHEVFGNEKSDIELDWEYRGVPIQLREDLKDFEIYPIYNCEGISFIPSYAKKE